MPNDVALFANARVGVMRDKDAFGALRRSVVRYGCITEGDFDWIAGATDRLLLASRGDSERPEFVAVLVGQYTDTDAARALDLLARRAGTQDATGTRKAGRFVVSQKGPWSAVVLENRLLVAGHDGFVGSVIDVIEHPPESRYAQGPMLAELGAKMECLERSVCALITPGGSVARRMRSELAGVGMKKVGRQLSEAQTGLSAAVGEGMNVSVISHLGSEDDANSLAKDTRDWLWQAGLVARLAGFPDVLGDAEVNTDGRFTNLKIKVGEGDLGRLEQRLHQLLGDEAAAKCPQS